LTKNYFVTALKPKMKSHYRGHKMAVWLNLIPQLHQPGDEDVSMRHHHFHEREPSYYAGAVRAESFTRLPPPLHPASMTDSHAATGDGTECVPNTTAEDDLEADPEIGSGPFNFKGHQVMLHEFEAQRHPNLYREEGAVVWPRGWSCQREGLRRRVVIFLDDIDEDSEELLQRLATRHYYSYTAALGVTVGVGCLLLVLNMLIFAGIYYQRERDRRRQSQPHSRQSRSNSTPSTETIPMSQRPSTPGSSARQSPIIARKEKHELPPSYSAIPNSTSLTSCQTLSAQNTLRREKPPPPMRTSSNPSGGTIKKRVQIQEISV
ncbi:hypothetical protein NQ318_008756, partial [Aromia moschata]